MAADQVEESSCSDPELHPSDQYKITRYFEKKVITLIYCHLTIVKESICSNKVYPEVKKHENNNSKGGFNVMRKPGLPCHFH